MSAEPARRARRLLRCYPPAWRARYGEEFVALLIDDIAERPRCASRTSDILRTSMHARLADAGLVDDDLPAHRAVRAGLAWLGLAACAFLSAGLAVWSQLTVGWQWSAPAASGTRTGMVLMSWAIALLAALVVLAIVPLAWLVLRARGRGLARPLLAVGVAAAVLIVGGVHIGHGWPGTTGHPWRGRDLVPTPVARFCWAVTLWATSYWAHPHALARFPAGELAWMAASPLALLAMAVGGATTVRRLALGNRLLRYELWLGALAVVAMAAFLAGAGSWIVSGGPAPNGLFRVGTIDAAALAVMALTLALGYRAVRRSLMLRGQLTV